MGKRQTAVEWLNQILVSKGIYFEYELYQQAKAMEKEQMFGYIKKNYVNGENSLKFHTEEFEIYYNETYGE